MRWLPAALVVAVVITACGGASSSKNSDPGSAARGFVAAVTSGDRRTWCSEVGSPLYGRDLKGPLSGSSLQSCVSSDLFVTTGSCDVERAISGASVTGVYRNRGAAKASLSSGAALEFRRVGGHWLFDGVTGRASHAPALTSGPCAGA